MVFHLPLRRQYREFTRARQIVEVLTRNGLGSLVELLGLTRFLPPWGLRRTPGPSETDASRSAPERVRHTLEELGPTFIKLGQVLSTRPDLLPAPYIEELTKLLDTAAPEPYDVIASQVERELGQAPDQCFAEFKPIPLASASIGQVHRGRLHSGETVIVKVQRPAVEETIQADLDLLSRQARFLDRHSRVIRDYRVPDLVEELAYTLQSELDYTFEGRNADRLRRNLRDDPEVTIPHVYWELTTRRVITLEALEGLSLADSARLVQEGYDLPSVAESVVRLYLKQVLRDGFFHADPHPANILLCGDQIGLVDFGMVGSLTRPLRESLGDLVLGVLEQDAQQLTRLLLRMGAVAWDTDTESLERDLHRLITRYYGVAMREVSLREVVQQGLDTAFRHQVRIPPELVVLARAAIVLEGVATRLDPDLVLVDVARPFARRFIAERYSPRQLGKDLVSVALEGNRLIRGLPRHVETLLGQTETGTLTIGLAIHRLEEVVVELDRVANRLAFSVVVAAIAIASALLTLGGAEAAVWPLPLIGWALPVAKLGFVVAGLMGMWLLLSILRARGL